jgi:hypothetical protein
VIIDLVLTDFGYLVLLLIRSPRALAAETLFLRSENNSPVSGMSGHTSSSRRRHPLGEGRLESLVELARSARLVKPDTLSRWHGKGFLLLLAHEIPARRPTSTPRTAAAIYPTMVEENILSVQERIASELKRKAGIRVAPSPVPRSLGWGSRPAQDPPRGDWPSFVTFQ